MSSHIEDRALLRHYWEKGLSQRAALDEINEGLREELSLFVQCFLCCTFDNARNSVTNGPCRLLAVQPCYESS
ncbi:hypothetical protein KIN20_000876 [Parelaphostrongylus tenuis]|uniref:Uncharacterized protein n=1 Tax=Parelaphostrongylus tenuis TaxID=148309 RepID=A0AAD5MC00_PARTN|nr:hypothetical protein KIN20_000876 [Parelaphostrongylus tenuis]